MFFYLSAFGFLSCLFLGGGTSNGHISDAVLQLLSIPVLLTAIWRLTLLPQNHETRRVLGFCGALLALPILQLIPLPPAIWTHLPGREPVTATIELLGRSFWAPLSMAPESTWLGALSLLPPLAVFLAVLTLDWPQRRLLSLSAIAFGVASAFLGLTQLAQGPTSQLRFFEITNENSAVGFFANKNHFAALLYCLIVLGAAWLVAIAGALRVPWPRKHNGGDAPMLLTIAFALALLALLVVEVIVRSRAGIILTSVGLLAAFAPTFDPSLGTKHPAPVRLQMIALLAGVAGLALIFRGNSALFELLQRFEADPLADARVVFARNTILAAQGLTPFGAGLGAFVPVYATFEKPSDLLPGNYANHAHNDLLELWLETGLAGPLLLCLFLYWLIGKAWRTWNWSERGLVAIDQSLRRAAILIISLLLSHSLVDYPLRTSAMMTIMAFACALLIDPAL